MTRISAFDILAGTPVASSRHSVLVDTRQQIHSLDTNTSPHFRKVGHIMLSWAITFLIIALVAAVLGFGVLAGTAMGIAKILFLVFLVLFVISLVAPRLRPPA